MNIEMIRKAKSELEDSIRDQINQFCTETNVVITDVDLDCIERRQFDGEIRDIDYMVKVTAEV